MPKSCPNKKKTSSNFWDRGSNMQHLWKTLNSPFVSQKYKCHSLNKGCSKTVSPQTVETNNQAGRSSFLIDSKGLINTVQTIELWVWWVDFKPFIESLVSTWNSLQNFIDSKQSDKLGTSNWTQVWWVEFKPSMKSFLSQHGIYSRTSFKHRIKYKGRVLSSNSSAAISLDCNSELGILEDRCFSWLTVSSTKNHENKCGVLRLCNYLSINSKFTSFHQNP